ncbi:hypothetical protein [Sphingomicrobium astaxanthinifaciens]|uniref:hypothetical protein n=1 Tax=Sphingomicrobium astaxanthinifaciens TaxID=1227949 RepID=UPI001FCB0F85|nr:hypothetical protein [Sphingomicrobium astaxanthinifaciens]MCJ7420877.1 hypothetical protein [Sphingomicrobium astaxanthinifaciens]
MIGEGRPEEVLVGIVAGVLALLVGTRLRTALREGVIPLYKVRKTRAELGPARFGALVAINAGAMLLLAWIALDLVWLQRG